MYHSCKLSGKNHFSDNLLEMCPLTSLSPKIMYMNGRVSCVKCPNIPSLELVSCITHVSFPSLRNSPRDENNKGQTSHNAE